MQAKPFQDSPAKRSALLTVLRYVFVGALLVAFTFGAWHELREIHWHDVGRAFGEIKGTRVAVSIFFVLANYLVLSLYDWASFRVLGLKLEWTKVAPRACAAFAFSNFVGLGFVSGAAVRLRLYKDLVPSPATLARVIALNSISLWSGLLATVGVALIASPVPLYAPGKFSDLRHLGPLFLALPTLWLGFAAAHKWLPERVRQMLRLPPLRARQIALLLAVASADWITLAGVYLSLLGLMPPGTTVAAATGFWLSHLTAMLSLIPAGLGIFEAAVTNFLSQPDITGNASAVLAAALAYRVLYYLVPWLLALIGLGTIAAFPQVARFVPATAEKVRKLEPTLQEILSETLAILAFVAGAVLWISAAVPAIQSRVDVAASHIPGAVFVIAASHFSSVIAGAVLILVSFGLQHRHRESWIATEVALILGAVFTFLKGLDFEEAIFLLAVAAVFWWARDRYDRKGRALSPRVLATAWGAALACAVAYIAVGLWINRGAHGELLERLLDASTWTEMGLKADQARFLRSLLPVAGLIAWLLLAVRWSGDRPPAPEPSPQDVEDARRLLAQHATSTLQELATLGDKALWFSAKRDGFIAWQRRGSTILALGDPVGPPDTERDLIREFRRFADEWDLTPAFYQVPGDRLADYHALGFSFFQLGEEGIVDIAGFSTKGDAGKGYRAALNRGLREGLTFDVLPAIGKRDDDEAKKLLATLKDISDSWLKSKNTAEKRFSLGYWDEAYVRECPIAVVRQGTPRAPDAPPPASDAELGPIIGFANILATGDKHELTVDLMRHKGDELDVVMDFLFINLLLWGKEQGYRDFNLGMSPLAGVGEEAFAKPLERAARLLFLYGEHFYNFRGLRRFKEKFHPHWEPRYLAVPAEWQVPRVLVDVAAITSGGYRAIVAKR